MAAISASPPSVDAWSAGVAAGISSGATPLPPTRPPPPAQPRAPPPAPPAGLSKRTSAPAPPRSPGAWTHVGLSSGASVVGALCPALELAAAMPATLGVATDDPWRETAAVPYDPWEETETALAQSSPAPLLSAEDAWDTGEALAAVPSTCGAWPSTGLRAPTTADLAPPPLLPAADAWDPWEPRATWTPTTPALTSPDLPAARGFWCTTAPHASSARPSVAYDPYASYDPWAA